jgi:putative transposase
MATILKAYKYRMYPNKMEEELLRKHIGCNRWVYNWALDKKTKAYKEQQISLSRFDIQKELPSLKQQPETSWLGEVNAQSLQATLEHLDRAYRRFFKMKQGFPKFKSKHGSKQSFRIPQYVSVDWEKSRIHLAKTGDVKIRIDRKATGIIKSATITLTSTGKWFVSVLVDTGMEEPNPHPITKENAVGIDLGINHFAVLSTGEKIKAPKPLARYQRRLKWLQSRASKKVKGSNNRRKANKRVARQYERISNIRRDFLHKVSTRIIRENQTVCLEDLNVQGMMQNHKLAKSISDVSWSEFVGMLEYKARWTGGNILKIGRFDPSSKLCNKCGHVNSELTLKDRSWKCPKCCTIHDRDSNASINIRDFALMKTTNIGEELPDLKPVENRANTSSRKVGSKPRSVKQETQTSLVSG